MLERRGRKRVGGRESQCLEFYRSLHAQRKQRIEGMVTERIIKVFVVLFFMVNVTACGQSKNNEGQTEKELIAMKDCLPQYPKEKQISYIVHMNTKTPYELYLDDILIGRRRESGFSESVELNPYLLQNGIHKLKLRYLPRESSEDMLVYPQDIIADEYTKWNTYFIELKKDPSDALGYSEPIDYGKAELKAIAPPTAVPVWEQEWDIEVNNLPYDLRGWRDGEDLSQWDQEELEKEVVAFYNHLRSLLNEGNIIEFMRLTKRQDFETGISVYDTPEVYEADFHENVDLLTEECVGNMLLIDNYVMKLYANGKIAALEIPEGKYKYWSALMSDSKKYGKSAWGIVIYKPKGEKDFVAIRK